MPVGIAEPGWMAASAFALAGLLLGSFLNVCIARLPRRRSIVRPGSACPRCGAPIAPYDNVPVLSWLLLRGRCRRCRGRIPVRYPLVEAGLAALFVVCAWRVPGLPAVEGCVLCFLLLGLGVMDLETMRLPDAFTLPGIALGLGTAFLPGGGVAHALALTRAAPFALSAWPPWLGCAVAAAGAAGLLWLVRALYQAARGREGMGMGDIKLAALLGAWLGTAGVALALFLGVVGAALAGLLMTRGLRRGSGTARLPLGSFLCAAALAVLICGRPILAWYFNFWR